MTSRKWNPFVIVTMAIVFVASVRPVVANTDFIISPLDLGSGYTLTGHIVTDGTVGPLTSVNIVSWDITVTAADDYVFNPTNTSNLSFLVHTDGNTITVQTSPDGIQDGGSLWFRGGNYNQVKVADFTGANRSGGQAYFVKGGFFGYLPLNQPNNADYVAATSHQGSTRQFDLVPLDFGSGVTMFGSITTDGDFGNANITDWNVVVRSANIWNFTSANSNVLFDYNLSSDGTQLLVTPVDEFGSYGQFIIGSYVGSHDLNGVLLADFSYDPGGEAGLVTPFVYQTTSPLDLDINGNRVVATAVVEPTVIVPETLNVLRGLLVGGTLQDVFESDDSRIRFNPGLTINSTEAPVWLIFDGALPSDNPSSVQIMMESQAGTPGLSHTLEAWNWSSGVYDVVDISESSFNTDNVVTIDLGSSISDYVESQTGAVRTRLGWRKTGFTINFPWEVRLDQLVWIAT